jgi:hypothetical protein
VTGGAKDFLQPQAFTIDGCEITFQGKWTRTAMTNGVFSTSQGYNYRLTPRKTGTFTVPAVAITVDGKALQTSALSLTVTDVASAPAGEAPPCFAEIISPTKTATPGQSFDVEIRFGVNDKTSWRPGTPPVFLPEGCICENEPEPAQGASTFGGATYQTFTFHARLTPLKPGPLTLGPLTFQYETDKPGSGALGGLGGNFFLRSERQEVQAPAVTVEVTP